MYETVHQVKKVHPPCGPKNSISHREAIVYFIQEYGKNRKATAHEDSIELAFPRPIKGFSRISELIFKVNYCNLQIGTLFYNGREEENQVDYVYCFQPEPAIATVPLAKLTDYFRLQDPPTPQKRKYCRRNSSEPPIKPKPDLPREITKESVRKLERLLRVELGKSSKQ